MIRGHWVALGFTLVLLAGCASSSPSPSPTENGPLMHYQLARVNFDQGRVDDALREIDLSLRQDKSLPQVHFFKGFIYYSMGDYAKAEPCFRSAIELDPYYTDARMYLAATCEEQGRSDEALAELDRALANRTYPSPEKILVNKALILNRRGEAEAALATLRQAVEVRPRYYRAHLEMGRLLEKSGRDGEGEAEAALATLRQAVEVRPRYYRAHLEMGRLLEKSGRDAEALAAYETAAVGYEQDAAFHYEYGRALFRNRREVEAKRELGRAIELAPGSETATKAQELLAVIG